MDYVVMGLNCGRGLDFKERVRLPFLGDDETGRALEVIAVEDDGVLIVIHAMDLRPKFRALYEEGKRT